VTSLPVGVGWPVPGGGLTVTVTSATTTSARVEVTPDVVTSAPPTPVITAPAGGSVIGPRTILSWRTASAVASLRVLVDGRQVAAPAAGALSGTVTLTGLANGRHTLTVQALASGGAASALSSAVAVTTDAQPPTTPAALTLSSAQVLGWRASTDAVSGTAGYLVSLDGATPTRLGTVRAMTTRTPVGRHTWWVGAVDRVGNVSPAAGLVVIRTSASSSARSTSVHVVSSSASLGQRTLVTGRTVGAGRAF
jgi:hypothetical protein